MTNLRGHSAKRELKFRAWDKIVGCWSDDPNSSLAKITLGLDGSVIIDDDCATYRLEDYIIEQFTGLLDKNGKAIYEGDICTVKIYWNELLNKTIKRGFVSRIAYSEHRALWFFPDYHNVAIDDAREDIEEVISIEIIGTIHDAEYKEASR